MAKVTLGARPKQFSKTVKFPMLEGGEGAVELQYIYRTRTEFGNFVDELMTAADVNPASAEAEDIKFSLQLAMEKTRDANADYIMKVVKGWNLDVDFSRANVVQFCDEFPGGAIAVMDAYRAAITEGRSGN